MRRTVAIAIALLAALLIATAAWAQAPSPEEVVKAYYAALGEAAATGDFSAILDLFADDATVTMAALSPQPIAGKTMMQAMFAGMSKMLKGVTITVDEISAEGDRVTVRYRMTSPEVEGEIHATDTFVVEEGKIRSLTIEISPEDLSKLAGFTLPVTGAASGGSLLPVLLIAAGAGLTALGWRLR